jgi:hypothetical protein
MNKKIFFITLLAASVLYATGAYAQGWGMMNRGYDDDSYRGRGCGSGWNNSRGYRDGYNNLDAMKAELGLSEQQTKQIFDLGTQYREKYFENRNNPGKLEDLRVEHRKAIENVLTKDQQEKYNRIQNGYGRFGWYGGCQNGW